DPDLAGLLSDEGVINEPRYPTQSFPPIPSSMKAVFDSAQTNLPESRGHFGELVVRFTFAPEVKIHINAPARESFVPGKPVLLIYFALPNGNTTEQTIGRK